MNDISQVCDIHIESSTQATAFDRPHKSDMRTADAPFFNRGMVGTVTTVITSDANSHGDISATKAPTKTSRHRTPVFSRLHKTKDGQPDASTDDTKRSHTQPNQFLEAESRIGRWSYALANSRTRDESPAKPAPAIPKMTKEEFDALPPIIQRKVSYDTAFSSQTTHDTPSQFSSSTVTTHDRGDANALQAELSKRTLLVNRIQQMTKVSTKWLTTEASKRVS